MLKMQDNQSNIISMFNPDESARILKVKIGNHTKLTEEIVSELYRAKGFYSSAGYRSDLVSDETRLRTFESYLVNIGIAKPTAYRWLERYVPEENKILTYEELTEKKTAEAQKKAAELRANLSPDERYRSLVSEFHKTGIKPLGWSQDVEDQMKRSDENYKKFQEERRREKKEREEAERLQRVKEAAEAQANSSFHFKIDSTFDAALKIAGDAIIAKSKERQTWKEKIRLSDGGKEDTFMDAIIDYLETLENDNRRIEACNNIIKICRNISVELQAAR